MDNFSVLMNEPSFRGTIKFKKAHLYDVNTGKFLSKKRRPVVNTNEIASITDAFLWPGKNKNKNINTLIQVINKNNQNLYYGVSDKIDTVMGAYLNVCNSDKSVNFAESKFMKKLKNLFKK